MAALAPVCTWGIKCARQAADSAEGDLGRAPAPLPGCVRVETAANGGRRCQQGLTPESKCYLIQHTWLASGRARLPPLVLHTWLGTMPLSLGGMDGSHLSSSRGSGAFTGLLITINYLH